MSRDRKGFTLIELALVLIVIGILTGGSIRVFSAFQKRQKVEHTQEMLKAMHETIQGFAISYHRLPSQQEWEKLWLNHEDSWGKPIVYLFDKALTKKQALCTLNEATISVVQGKKSMNDVAYILFSGGPNRNKQIGYRSLPVYTAMIGEEVDYDESLKRKEPFDDLAEYVSLFQLKSSIQCNRSQPSERKR